MTLRIDLHTHSSVSDGTEPPYELVRLAQQAGLDIVAITDHDSLEGWNEAIEAAYELGMGLVPGMELSTQIAGKSIHLVSYLVNPEHEALLKQLEKIRNTRSNRARTIVENLSADYNFDWEMVLNEVPDGSTIGRPHIADALVTAGYAPDRTTAFQQILHPSRGYTTPLLTPSPVEGIELIRQAGGVPVLAHPGTSRFGHVVPRETLAELVDAGLFGLEIEHPENLPENTQKLYDLAQEFDLAVTGSSDWHGTGKINRLGEKTTDPKVFEKLVESASGFAPILP